MFTVSLLTDHGCYEGSAHLCVNANPLACLYLQTKLIFISRSRGEDFDNSDWFAWLYRSRYTAAYVFGIVMMALGVVLMRVHVNRNNLACTTLFLKTEGRNISFCKYPAMCKRGLSPHTNL